MPNPELIFVSGPQAGERRSLTQRSVVAGRAPSCEIRLVEEFVSRQQFRIENTADGWVVENLSSHGTLINDKKFKAGKKVILDTGDVLSVGAMTRIMFVSADDDGAAALEQYRQQHPQNEEVHEVPDVIADGETKEVPQTSTEPQAAVAEEPAEEATPAAPPSKLRKYGIYAAIYLAALVALAVALSSINKTDGTGNGPPAIMEQREIEESLSEPLKRGVNSNMAAEHRQKAINIYDGRSFRTGGLQACVKLFKLSLASQSGNKIEFDDFKVNEMYRTSSTELADQVYNSYRSALILEKGGQWVAAIGGWEKLRVVIPQDSEWDTTGYEKLSKNIASHAAYCRQQLKK